MGETADELRKRLKYEREQSAGTTDTANSGREDSPAVNSTSRDIELYAPNELNTNGYSIQPVSGQGSGTLRVKRTAGDTQGKLVDKLRSIAQVDHGKRQRDRRSGEDHGQDRTDGTDVPASVTKSKRAVGNLETYDEIPPRSFESDAQAVTRTENTKDSGSTTGRKRGRPPKQRTIIPFRKIEDEQSIKPEKERRKNFLNGPTLSKQEAKELEEPLIAALTDELALADKALWKAIGDPLEQPVWSDITEKEMTALSNVILKLGQKSPLVATGARVAVDGSDYIVAIGIVAPRFQKTVSIIKEARKHAQAEHRQSKFNRLRERHNQST